MWVSSREQKRVQMTEQMSANWMAQKLEVRSEWRTVEMWVEM